MITGLQLRSARAALRWSASALAEKTGITRITIQRLEKYDDIPPSRTQSLVQLKRIFEENNIEFLEATEHKGPGIRYNGKPF